MHDPVRVAIDFKNPAAYLAIAPTRALEARLGLGFDWLPVSVAALIRPDPAAANEDRGARHRRIRARVCRQRSPPLRRGARARARRRPSPARHDRRGTRSALGAPAGAQARE